MEGRPASDTEDKVRAFAAAAAAVVVVRMLVREGKEGGGEEAGLRKEGGQCLDGLGGKDYEGGWEGRRHGTRSG